MAELTLDAAPLPVDLGDPVTNDRRLGAMLEDTSVAGELGLAFLEASANVELDYLMVVLG